ISRSLIAAEKIILGQLEPRFAISTCTTRYGRYIPVRQVTGTRTARYRAVLPKIDRRRSISAVGGRLKKKSTVDGRLREKSTVGGRLRKKKRRRRGKEEKKKRRRKKYLARAVTDKNVNKVFDEMLMFVSVLRFVYIPCTTSSGLTVGLAALVWFALFPILVCKY
ncbi:hypothetical protein GW17_00053426, partial [Ensete ventricosum]